MNIFHLLGFKPPVATLPSYACSQVSQSTKKFITALKEVKNTANAKGDRISKMYEKTEKYAKGLQKSAEAGNLKKTLENVSKLQKHSSYLLAEIGNPLTKVAISNVNAARVEIMQQTAKFMGNPCQPRN